MSALAAYSALGDDWRLPVLVSNVRIVLLPSAPGCAPDLALLRADRLNKEGIGVGRLRRSGTSLAAASARKERFDWRGEVRSWVRSGSALLRRSTSSSAKGTVGDACTFNRCEVTLRSLPPYAKLTRLKLTRTAASSRTSP